MFYIGCLNYQSTRKKQPPFRHRGNDNIASNAFKTNAVFYLFIFFQFQLPAYILYYILLMNNYKKFQSSSVQFTIQ